MSKISFLWGVLIVLSALMLVLIRGFEDFLFYDPLLDFFKTNYTHQSIPEMNRLALLSNLGFRYFLNTLFSLLIIWFFFHDKEIIKVSVLIYSVFFIVVFAMFTYIIYTGHSGYENTPLFYVRRFLIQPLLLLVLLPAFFFHKFKSQ